MNEYTVVIAVMSDGAQEPRLVLKHVRTESAPTAIAEATAAVLWQHDDEPPTFGEALVFDGRLEIASHGPRLRRESRPPALELRRHAPARTAVVDGAVARAPITHHG